MGPKVIICSLYPPFPYGIAMPAQRKARGLFKVGWDVEVVTTTAQAPGQPETDPFPVHRQLSRKRILDICRSADVIIVEGDALVYLIPALKSQKPVMVVHHNQRPACLFPNRRIDPNPVNPAFRFVRYFIIRHYLGQVALNVSVSQRTAELNRLPNSMVIPNPLDLADFADISPPMALGEEQRQVGYFGRLVKEKGVGLILRTLAKLSDRSVLLNIYGEGPVKHPLEFLAGKLGIRDRVVFHGVVRGDDLNAAYRSLRCVLIPSQWEESFCNVAAEAMYCGTPVIGSDRGGLPTTIGPGGLVVPAGDVRRLAQATEQVITSDPLHARLAAEGRTYVIDNFSNEVVVRRNDQVLRAIIRGARGPELTTEDRPSRVVPSSVTAGPPGSEREVSPKVIVCSVYPPTRYGIAVAAQRQARGLHKLGWRVRVLTTTSHLPEERIEEDPFPVYRNLSTSSMISICRSADVVLIEGDALAFIRSVASSGRPFVVVHHNQRLRT